MRETAEVVIIGAGVNGASLAFHLAQMGVQKVISDPYGYSDRPQEHTEPPQ